MVSKDEPITLRLFIAAPVHEYFVNAVE